MSFSSGFFNAVDHDRKYNATEMGQLFDGLITDGVYEKIGDCFIVKAYSGNVLKIGTGRAWFNNTWSYNDSIMLAEADLSDQLLPRIDALVLEVNSSTDVRENSIKFVQGTAASNPVKPTLENDDYVHQYPLAYITRPANSTEITQSNITNAVGTSACPFVTGIVDQNLVIDDLLLQWSDEYERYILSKQTNFNNWSEEQKEAYESWASKQETDFDTWFETIQDKLDGDTAGKLANDIAILQQNVTDLQDKDTELDDTKEDKPIEIDTTLTTGSTSLTVSNDGIKTDSIIDIYTNVYGVNPKDAVTTDGKIVLTFSEQKQDINIKVVIR